ncbi:HNH endonuclease [Halorussus salinisoli]|uniref:HNH endonuclease n=1 Tax=Halorussus salinisoli TaxID=2558242 RepID=UPI00374256B2
MGSFENLGLEKAACICDLGLLDVAHVLLWSEYPEYWSDLTNVLPLSRTYHAAFDRELFRLTGSTGRE